MSILCKHATTAAWTNYYNVLQAVNTNKTFVSAFIYVPTRMKLTCASKWNAMTPITRWHAFPNSKLKGMRAGEGVSSVGFVTFVSGCGCICSLHWQELVSSSTIFQPPYLIDASSATNFHNIQTPVIDVHWMGWGWRGQKHHNGFPLVWTLFVFAISSQVTKASCEQNSLQLHQPSPPPSSLVEPLTHTPLQTGL